ncbi:MAG: diguanylate cyclase, partial [Gemmatimonadaceae bacterium]|nr:diguanylate cyclase [Gemmatimonadaceae bacterium]
MSRSPEVFSRPPRICVQVPVNRNESNELRSSDIARLPGLHLADSSLAMLDQTYNYNLVVLSVLIATIGAYVAIEIAQRVRAAVRRRRLFWVYGGALAMGLGIWSMHFVAMLALHLPIPVWYDAPVGFLSFVAAVVGCMIAFAVFNRATVGSGLLGLASIFMGFAIAGMHYTGMAAMRMNSHVLYDPLMFAASVGVAIVVSFAALALTRNLLATSSEPRAWVKKFGASLLMGLAVAGMHYTGMAAASFTRGPTGWLPTDNAVFGSYELGLVVAATSAALLGIALAATQFERWTLTTRGRFEHLLELSPQV